MAEYRRVLLIGTNKAWRALLAYVFEDAGYVVYGAASAPHAVALARRWLPDVILIQEDTTHALATTAHLAGDSNTYEIPVVVLTPSLHSFDAHRARAAGCVTLLPHSADMEVLLGEVDTLIPDAAHAKRTLKRQLLDLQELARFYRSEEDGQARLRRLIDHLQIPILGVDASGLCIAASEGATRLTGYSRLQLQTPSVFQSAFRRVGREEAADARTTTITTRTGEDVMVYAAALEEVVPGFHVAAFAAARPRVNPCADGHRGGSPWERTAPARDPLLAGIDQPAPCSADESWLMSGLSTRP